MGGVLASAFVQATEMHAWTCSWTSAGFWMMEIDELRATLRPAEIA
jgi:hypothetical protein